MPMGLEASPRWDFISNSERSARDDSGDRINYKIAEILENGGWAGIGRKMVAAETSGMGGRGFLSANLRLICANL